MDCHHNKHNLQLCGFDSNVRHHDAIMRCPECSRIYWTDDYPDNYGSSIGPGLDEGDRDKPYYMFFPKDYT